MTCKDCIHHRVCFKQSMRDKITPKGFELQCIDFKNKADFVKMARCCDCEYSCGDCEKSVFSCMHPKGLYMPTPNDFCSYGERKDT